MILDWEFGTNPCSEIILRPYQFCNLSEVVVRATDDIKSLSKKVKLATIIGTIQSSLTKFPYLRKVWQNNTEEERLLGVSLTGIMDNPLLTAKNKGLAQTLDHLRHVAVDTNKEWAVRLGVQQSTAITCVKPSWNCITTCRQCSQAYTLDTANITIELFEETTKILLHSL